MNLEPILGRLYWSFIILSYNFLCYPCDCFFIEAIESFMRLYQGGRISSLHLLEDSISDQDLFELDFLRRRRALKGFDLSFHIGMNCSTLFDFGDDWDPEHDDEHLFVADSDTIDSLLVDQFDWYKLTLIFIDDDSPNRTISAISDRLRFDSKVFVIYNNALYEWYKTWSEGNVLINTLGVVSNDGMISITNPRSIWKRRGDLGGLEMKAVYVDSEPFVFKNKSGQLQGIMHELAMTIGESLNVNFNLIENKIYGELLENGTWIGIMGDLQNNNVDLTISDLSITQLRSRTVDFSMGIFEQSCVLFMQLPRQSLSWTTFVDVFDHTSWITLTLTTILSVLFLHFILKYNGEADKNRGILKSLSSVLLTYGALSISENFFRWSSRWLFLVMCLFGAIMYWSYNAILVSLLTVDFYTLPIQNLHDLAVNSQYQILVDKGTAFAQYFEKATPSLNAEAKIIFDDRIAGNPRAYVKNPLEAGQLLMKDPKLVYFGEDQQAKLTMDGYPCNIVSTRLSYFKNYVSFAFPKGSPYVRIFSDLILVMRQSGQVDDVLHNYYSAKDSISCQTEAFKAIKYENIFTAFLVLAVGTVASFTLLVIEKFGLCKRKRRPPKVSRNRENQAKSAKEIQHSNNENENRAATTVNVEQVNSTD